MSCRAARRQPIEFRARACDPARAIRDPLAVTAELAIIVPTLNEVENVEPFVDALERALDGVAWEAVFVDDGSTDGTGARLDALAAAHDNLRVIHRAGRSGLASACCEGIEATAAPFVAVIDADHQYDEALLPDMLRAVRDEDAEIAIASRFAPGADAAAMASPWRERFGRWAGRASRLITRAPTTDPLSGCFVMRRALYDAVSPRLTGRGSKLLVDILTSLRRPVPVRDLAVVLRPRRSGASKTGVLAMLELLLLVLDKLFLGLIPTGFILYILVGLIGLAVHIALLGLLFRIVGLYFFVSQAVATIVAMTVNFHFNNVITFRDRRLSGRAAAGGLMTFYAACSIGAVINLAVAQFLFDRGLIWILAGISGAVVGAVWNYVMNATFTWKRR